MYDAVSQPWQLFLKHDTLFRKSKIPSMKSGCPSIFSTRWHFFLVRGKFSIASYLFYNRKPDHFTFEIATKNSRFGGIMGAFSSHITIFSNVRQNWYCKKFRNFWRCVIICQHFFYSATPVSEIAKYLVLRLNYLHFPNERTFSC